MQTTTLYVIRHGESEGNRFASDRQVGPDYGPLGSPLTPEGRRQISELAERLKQVRFDLLICSDLIRARESAQILSEVLALSPVTTDKIRERVEPETTIAGGKRLNAFLRETARLHTGKTVAVVCHGAIMRGLLIALGYASSTRELPKGSLRNAGLIILETNGEHWHVSETLGVTREPAISTEEQENPPISS
ncbi:MAG: histidine phosphatase family protein [Ktedonobacteraceae bacterium]|nr:histidine phosphatase family protein [Ktedonobacteraceae bacterium]